MALIESRTKTVQLQDGRGAAWPSQLDGSRELATLAVLVLILAGLIAMAAPVLTWPDKVEAA